MTGPRTLSLFSGAGGLDLGGRLAGYDLRLATDVDASSLRVLATASGTPTIEGDVDELLKGRLQEAWGQPRPDVIIGGPPCTGFSHAGFWISDKLAGLDPATALIGSFAQAVEAMRPEAFLLENVPGLAFKTHRSSLVAFLQRMRAAGYATWHDILNASDFGVAQARRRLFVAGVRSKGNLDLTRWAPYPRRSAGWALTGVAAPPEPDELPGVRYRDLLPLVPPGRNYLVFTAERSQGQPALFKNRGRYWSFLLKIDPGQPAPTLPAQRLTYNGPFHWANRHLRIREMARLQAFPDWYPLDSSLPTARRHIGNAVPPVLAAAVLWQLRRALGDDHCDGQPPALEALLDPTITFSDAQDLYPDTRVLTPPHHPALPAAPAA